MQTRSRIFFYKLHQHLGLWIGVLFVLLGITGSLLTFYPEIDAFITSGIKPTGQIIDKLSAQKIYDVLRQEYPERKGSWRIELPMTKESAITARYYKPVETAHKKFAPIMVTIDPVSYKVTSFRYWGNYPATWIYDLHYTLLGDEFGHNTVGVVGVVLLLSIIFGYLLWMPKWGRITKKMKPVIRSQKVKKIYDLHMIFGIYGGILLAVIALTGVILAYPNISKKIALEILKFEQPMPTFRSMISKEKSEENLDRLIDKSKSVFPNGDIRWIETSGEDGREVTLRLVNGNEPSKRFPQSYLKLHPLTGEILFQRNYHELPVGDKLWAWVHPLHNGEAFGFIGRIIVTLLGLFPLILMLTGVLRFIQKRKSKIFIEARRIKTS